ncbi:hypothetical protein L7F22_051304 [Adiantum nelumboides]|nr:hypothetical protein [Adiantum nelumboides]
MGWVYAYAKETIIFMHYVGKPMAPIGPGDGVNELTCCWHTRVWTLQEAALSNRRRYCVRVGNKPDTDDLWQFQSLEDYDKEIGLCYAKNRSCMYLDILDGLQIWRKGNKKWYQFLTRFITDMFATSFSFPSANTAIYLGSGRHSKHVGDHINSILALTGVTDFVAPKDEDMELSNGVLQEERAAHRSGIGLVLI